MLALVLGVPYFVVTMLVGEAAGVLAGCLCGGAYLFGCQYLLSRGNSQSWRRDTGLMLCLNSFVITAFVLMVLLERPDVVTSQGLMMIVTAFAGTVAGASAACNAARRSTLRTH